MAVRTFHIIHLWQYEQSREPSRSIWASSSILSHLKC